MLLDADSLVEFHRFDVPINGFRSMEARNGWLLIVDDANVVWTLDPSNPESLTDLAERTQDAAWPRDS